MSKDKKEDKQPTMPDNQSQDESIQVDAPKAVNPIEGNLSVPKGELNNINNTGGCMCDKCRKEAGKKKRRLDKALDDHNKMYSKGKYAKGKNIDKQVKVIKSTEEHIDLIEKKYKDEKK